MRALAWAFGGGARMVVVFVVSGRRLVFGSPGGSWSGGEYMDAAAVDAEVLRRAEMLEVVGAVLVAGPVVVVVPDGASASVVGGAAAAALGVGG